MQGKAQIDQVLRQKCDAKEIPGVVAMAADGNGVIYQGAFGKRDLSKDDAMTTDSVFWIASMTKAITAAAGMQLVEQGKLSLDAPIGEVLPDLAGPQVLEGFDAQGEPKLRPAKSPITLRHLMTARLVDDGVMRERTEQAHQAEVLALGVMASRAIGDLLASPEQGAVVAPQAPISAISSGTPVSRAIERKPGNSIADRATSLVCGTLSSARHNPSSCCRIAIVTASRSLESATSRGGYTAMSASSAPRNTSPCKAPSSLSASASAVALPGQPSARRPVAVE